MNFSLRTAFAVSHKIWIVVSSFSFVSRNFLISSLISFSTQSLLIACYSISMSWSFFKFFPWGWFPVSVPCGWRRCLIWFQFSEFVEACFVSYHVVYIWKCSMCIWKECAFCFNSMLLNLHEFECFWVFSLRLVSSFRPLWLEKMLDMISIFLNFLRLVLCPASHVAYLWKCSMCICKECIFCCLGMKVSVYIS